VPGVGSNRFPLAPMSTGIAVLTAALLAMPVLFVAVALFAGGPPFLLGVGLLVAALYAAVWLWARPTAFEMDRESLRVCFPLWTRRIPLVEVAEVRRLDAAALRRELGFAVRIGVGGLWGGFGWLWTRRRGIVELYVSRIDDCALIERRGGRPLLVTPAETERFAGLLAAARSG